MNPFFRKVSQMHPGTHFLLFMITGGFWMIPLVVAWIFYSKERERLISITIENPCDETVNALMELTKKVVVTNQPAEWQRLRGIWNVVNHSNRVTTPTKQKLLALFVSKGLVVNSTNVVDNYNK